jgi:hypothetical protein
MAEEFSGDALLPGRKLVARSPDGIWRLSEKLCLTAEKTGCIIIT